MKVLDEQEWAWRLRRYEQLRDQCAEGLDAAVAATAEAREAYRGELDEILGRFRASSSAVDLKTELDSWGRKAREWGLSGMSGQMFLNQLVNDSDPATLNQLLSRAIELPIDRGVAEQVMAEFTDHVQGLRDEGSSAQVGRIVPFLSWFWWAQQPDQWPMRWSSVWEVLNGFGFELEQGSAWENYDFYRQHIDRFGDLNEVEYVLDRIKTSGDYGLDITTCERLAIVGDTNTPEAGADAFERSKDMLELLREMSKPLGISVRNELQQLFNTDITLGRPSIWWNSKANTLRRNLYVSWLPNTDAPSPSLLLIADGT